ncbi:tetratricopeptide repeat protein [Flagellimonas myxillae]|uniref:tetratricopeptide repeat protein n=1 Tax=Flagellimonas myxillae TaxID=2942214 RepID=UPI00201FAF3E|nr:tetratricopeptide repeat protein [Muricauda myxillae]MCL6266717.1 tetratricopeptide repeat protein [Muricauda myxillae]
MKLRLFLLLNFFLVLGMTAQTDEVEQVAGEACPCIAEIETTIKETKKFKQIEECISSSILAIQLKSSFLGTLEKTADTLNSLPKSDRPDSLLVEGGDITIEADKNYDEIEEYLLRNCDAMKLLMSSRDLKSENSVSNRKRAQVLYDKGQVFFQKGKFKDAIREYKKALKVDDKFAFAWDMLGYSHRKLGEYDEAIKYYRKSLEVDPKGKMPLINIAYAQEFKKDYNAAIEAMDHYIGVYPDEAEGYYGRGRLFHLQKDYNRGLDDMFRAYLMYKSEGSPYAQDAEHSIGLFYNDMKEEGKLELFNEIAKKHNIEIND